MSDVWLRNTLYKHIELPRYNGYIAKGDKWYNTNGGIVGSIKGTDARKRAVGREGATVLDNCTGFAACAFNEAYYLNKKKEIPDLPELEYFQINNTANEIIIRNINRRNNKGELLPTETKHVAIKKGLITYKELSECYIPPSGTPPIGGLIFWGGGGACHVAHIVDVTEDGNKIKVAQSGWGTPSWTTESSDGKGYYTNIKELTRDRTISPARKNLWWYNGANSTLPRDIIKLNNGAHCQGFVANPAISLINILGTHIPTINNISQTSPTSLLIEGVRDEEPPYATCISIYYKWDSNQVSTDNYDGVESSYDLDFKINIKKPRKATSVAILPVYKDNNGKKIEGAIIYKSSPDIYSSHPCIYILDGGVFKKSAPHIYNSSTNEWEEVIPTLRQGKNWYELYDTGKEKVNQ